MPDTLVTISSGYEYQTADDTVETYDSSGRLVAIAARGQPPVSISHAAVPDFTPSSVTDAYGHTLAFSYQKDSNNIWYLVSVKDPAGNTIAYGHTASNDTKAALETLTSVTYPDGSARAYGYGASHSALAAHVEQLTDESGAVFATWTYDAQGDLVSSSQHAGGADAYQFSYQLGSGANQRTVIDPLGTTRTFNMQLVQGVSRTVATSATCAGCTEDAARAYDSSGNILSRTDFNGTQTTYEYDTARNLESSRTEAYGSARARTITTQWDPSWRQPDLITEPNRTTADTYDSMGNVLTRTVTDTTVTPNASRTWTYTYDSYGRMLTAKGPRTDVNDTTTYTYYTCTMGAQCGQLQTVTDAAGHVTTYNTYNAYGQPLTITDPNGVVTALTYDARQRLTSRVVGGETTSFSYYPTGLLQKITLPDGSFLSYIYDQAHRLTEVDDGAGNRDVYTLDAMGNRTAENVYDPSNALARTHTRVINTFNEISKKIGSAGTAAVTTVLGYDNNGNETSIGAPLSRNATNAYDELNRLTQITDSANGVTKFGYNAEDELTSVTDPKSLTTAYSYNGFGDLIQQVSPDTGTTASTYDSGGNLATSTDARGAVSAYSYDALNRLTQVSYTLGGTTDQTVQLTYDAGTNGVGRLTGAADANHSLGWSYDGLGRVTDKTQTVGTVTKSVAYTYTNGDLAQLVTPSGQTVTYSYANHQITGIAVNGTTLLSNVLYEPFGPVSGWTWGNNTNEARVYDEDGNVTGLEAAEGFTLSYDDAFRITAITDNDNGSLSQSYGYDALDRLTSATGSTVNESWSYDANGNRLTQGGSSASTYSIAGSNNQVTGITGALTRTYSYAPSGQTLSTGSLSFTYWNSGRLASVTNAGATTSYVYNALGQRMKKSGPAGTEVFVYDKAGHLLGEYDGAENLIQETVWLGDIPVATLQPNGSGGINVFYVHTDQLNTPRRITRPSDNAMMWRWDSDPFGTTAANSNPSGLGTFTYNLRLPGQYYDAESGLMYNYLRDYDPQTGRYVESDPMGLWGRSYSTYSYVNDNPISSVDPRGLYLCMYSISAHNMSCTPDLPGDPSFSSNSYVSGNNGESSCQTCQNNPAKTNVSFHGPIPIGDYTIGAPTTLGGFRRNPTPDQSNQMLNRNSFQLHGCPNPATCSEGCIGATTNAVRDLLNKDLRLEEGQNTLVVLP